jgi:hypothetical protein
MPSKSLGTCLAIHSSTKDETTISTGAHQSIEETMQPNVYNWTTIDPISCQGAKLMKKSIISTASLATLLSRLKDEINLSPTNLANLGSSITAKVLDNWQIDERMVQTKVSDIIYDRRFIACFVLARRPQRHSLLSSSCSYIYIPHSSLSLFVHFH